MNNINNSKMTVVKRYYFKCDKESLPEELESTVSELEEALAQVKIDKFKNSSEKSRKRLFSPVCLNQSIKRILRQYGMYPTEGRKIICDYSSVNSDLNDDMECIKSFYDEVFSLDEFKKTTFIEKYKELEEELLTSDIELNSANKSWSNLYKGFEDYDSNQQPGLIEKTIKHAFYNIVSLNDKNVFINYITKDFVGFREIDFLKNDVGIEVQFGKYAFMVYNVCAKMKIFEKEKKIKYGVEIVPTKKMQKVMSTGVSFFEQFVWDLNTRGAFEEDIPVVILGVEPNDEGFLALKDMSDEDECSIANTKYE